MALGRVSLRSKYVQIYLIRSAQMGVVVDDHFRVKGFDNLRIVDASVLNQVTRMNPFFTLTSLGRYAGLLINEESLPPPPKS